MKQKKLTYEMICAAIRGDEAAETAIIEFYEPYIRSLSRIPSCTDTGEVIYSPDEELYLHLRLKLHELITIFQFR